MDAKILVLYLGCECKVLIPYIGEEEPQLVSAKFIGVINDKMIVWPSDINNNEWGHEVTVSHNDVKPILRPLSSMTEEERDEMEKTYNLYPVTAVHQHLMCASQTAKTFQYLLSKHFDLFGLIEKGEAIATVA